MALNAVEKNQEIMSLALEDRSSGYQDLVSNSNALLHQLQSRGNWKPYSGPTIRERLLYAKTGNVVWYNGYDFLPNSPAELFNDAEFRPKMVAVGVSLSSEEILNNAGEAQLLDVMEAHIAAAENELQDEMDTSLQSNGTRFSGKELGGLQLAIPTVVNSGTYGGIDRANAIWDTSSFDANSDFTGITQVTKDTIRPILNQIITQRSRGKQGADLLLMSSQHYAAYDAATVAIQRINDQNGLGKLGFQSLKYYGAGRQADIVQDGGIGSNMPGNVTYGIATDNMRMRYNPQRNFDRIFRDTMMPINQDARVQYIGFMGELTMNNPLFMWKLRDSNAAA